MTVTAAVEAIESELWPQGDARDPLGTWGFRARLDGDASVGTMILTVQVPAAKRSAFVYTIYGTSLVRIDGVTTIVPDVYRIRLLAGWPNIDPQAGVQGYSHTIMGSLNGDGNMTGNFMGIFAERPYSNADRMILMYDPRQPASLGILDLMVIEIGDNIEFNDWVIEGYGYYWDRSVMNTPGGPRHPGST